MQNTSLHKIKQRASRSDKNTTDTFKIGLAFDTGGYAGIVSSAMSQTLSRHKLLPYFDGFYGLSAGGLNAAYAASDQIQNALNVYRIDLPANNFGKKRQLLFRRLVMDIQVLKRAVTQNHPLDLQRALDASANVVCGVTALKSQKALLVQLRDKGPDVFLQNLLWGCHVPIASGAPSYDQKQNYYADGGLSWISSIHLAIEDGCTHVLSLANRPLGSYKHPSLTIKLVARWLESYSPGYGKVFTDFYRLKSRELRRLQVKQLTYQGVSVTRCFPESAKNLPSLFSYDEVRLSAGVRAGHDAMEQLLKEYDIKN